MKLWLVKQDESNNCDTYDSAVVAASTEEIARSARPGEGNWPGDRDMWASKPGNVSVELVGVATKQHSEGEIILASYNAG